LSKENKNALLEMIDPKWREAIKTELETPGVPGTGDIGSFEDPIHLESFTPNHEVLYEELIDFPKSTLKKAFSSFKPEKADVFFPPGQTISDELITHLGDIEEDGETAKFTKHLDKFFQELLNP
jgi:hypothetical protein